MNLPTTFIIGAQKCGTSSLFNWLSQHPDVYGPAVAKDIGFFSDNTLYNKGLANYAKNFDSYNGESMILAGGVHEALYDYALSRLKECCPMVKLIFVIRNPIDRAWSAYNFNKNRGIEQRSFAQVLTRKIDKSKLNSIHKNEFLYLEHGFYDLQIKKILTYFKPEQLKIILFDDIKINPQNVIIECLQFLEIDDGFRPIFNLVNETKPPKYKIINTIFFQDSRIKKMLRNNQIFNTLVPISFRTILRRRILFINSTKKKANEMLIEDRKELARIFAPHIASTSLLIQKDLSHWE